MVDKTEQYLKDISNELHQMNKVLGRMCQAPIFSKEAEKPTRWILKDSTLDQLNVRYTFVCEHCNGVITENGSSYDTNMDIRNKLPKFCPYCHREMVGVINNSL